MNYHFKGGEDMEMSEFGGITDHAKERIVERINNKTKKNPDELAEHVFYYGIPMEKARGSFYRWIDRRRYKYPDTLVKFYRNFIYIFNQSEPHYLITVFKIPKKFEATAKRIEKREQRNYS